MPATDFIELSLDHCIKCTICTAACPVSAVTDLFPGPKYVGPQAQRFRRDGEAPPDDTVDYCSGCRVCNEVCPTGVKIMEINTRAKARIVESRGVPLRSWLLGYQYLIGRLACGPLAGVANLFANLRWVRVLAEHLTGIAREAPLPSFSGYSFRSWARRHRDPHAAGATGRPKVVYFHGCATNYYEPRVGEAAVAVLEHNGFEVIIPEQGCCGLPLLSNGIFSHGRHHHQYNVAQLYSYAAQGIPIVGTSTSCTLTLKEEAPELLAMHDEQTRVVAEHTYDIFEFLRLLHERGRLNTRFRRIKRRLPYHAPCQQRAHRIGRPALDILELVPGLTMVESEAACCGLAGSYGYKVEKYRIAMDVGAELFDFIRASGSDLAVCDSEICRWQIDHGSEVYSVHPIELLREAYGLAPGA
ncbi:MAG: anaerobic glycerol-3-phosphate dehydrogenase subunit C [Chloroflexi bacterium]|nr:anaerobic glycerol-3-phosphate dehydrogenase subunit C [Chloroflexota bacterium]